MGREVKEIEQLVEEAQRTQNVLRKRKESLRRKPYVFDLSNCMNGHANIAICAGRRSRFG